MTLGPDRMETLRELIGLSPDLHVLFSESGLVHFVNGVGNLHGWNPRDEPISFYELATVPFRDSIEKEGVWTAKKGGRWEGEVRLACRATGREIPFRLSVFRTGDYFAAIGRDLSEKIAREEELAESRARQVAHARLASLGEMAGGIAHEINTPLNVVTGRAELIQRKLRQENPPSREELLKDAELILENGHRIAKIVRGLRAFSRDGEQDEKSRVTVASIIEETRSLCGERFRESQVAFLVQETFREEAQLDCRPTQILQVIVNLLNNAFDAAMESKSSERWVSLSVIEYEERMEFRVRDSGDGVLPDARERIMEPFFTTKEIGKGSGLGLSISSAIARDHGGELFLDLNEGPNCFRFFLPKGKTR